MRRQHPSPTRTDTPCPYTAFFRSSVQSSLFQNVQQSGQRPALTVFAFDRSETLRFGQGFERCNRYPVVAAPQEPNLVVLWNIGIEEQQFPFKLLPDRGAKRQIGRAHV